MPVDHSGREARASYARGDALRRFADKFESWRGNPGEPIWLSRIRKDAFARLAERGFPTSRDEGWKYSNVASFLAIDYRLADPAELTRSELASAGVDLWDGPQLVFVNGRYSPGLSKLGTLPLGVRAEPLTAAIDNGYVALVKRAFGPPFVEPSSFAALNAVFFTDGALLIIDRKAIAPKPVHLVYVTVSDGEPEFCAVRNLIVCEEASQVTVVETFLTLGEGKPGVFTDAVTQIVLEPCAILDHYRVQREGESTIHVGTQTATLDRGAQFRTTTFTLGGALVRNDHAALLDGEGAQCHLTGLYVASGDQKVDHSLVIDHAKPHGTSHQVYKGIVDDSAHGTFAGKVVVRPGAAKSDAHQTNQNLQLSPAAVVNTRPQLEIYNDDVQCSHGATIGQLDANALFYLRSRGLDGDEARALLTYAFAAELVEKAAVPAVRAAVSQFLLERLPSIHGLENSTEVSA
ncbi:MAG: Fe-S cluster assembly protein SufD [Candidatus Sericytochromatia bacterium]|uniref:Fe-S cluster assembly protein SufD n=1 Tax=Candidatus Tanganyikabacteria bacterium TaxID=2961651 RepID=A0A938BL48_9BACT|nr:Fe-S cluster assembly protein SufD [Candidatus Tanganyikabacteria bacterium]